MQIEGGKAMTRYKIPVCLLLVFGLLVMAVTAEAGNPKRRGTAGAQELLIPVGSVGTALGGAATSSLTGVEAIYWNPAGVAGSAQAAEVLVSHMEYIAGINVDYAAVTAQFGNVGWIGVSLKTLDFGDIPVTTELAPDGTGDTFSPTFLTLGLTYSKAMTDRILFGSTMKLVSEQITRESATGVAFDFGLQYATGVGGLKLGVALKNIGPNMKFSGSDLEVRTRIPEQRGDSRERPLEIPVSPFGLPTTLELGISYDLQVSETNRISLSGGFLNDNFGLDRYMGGIEYSLNDLIFVRGAYTVGFNSAEDKFEAGSEDFLFGPSFGAGIKYNIGGNVNLMLDYAYRTTEFFDNNQWVSLKLGF